MKVFVAQNEDYDLWVARTLKALIRVLEDECGGHKVDCQATHWVRVQGDRNAREANGWTMRWKSDDGYEYDIYLQRCEVIK